MESFSSAMEKQIKALYDPKKRKQPFTSRDMDAWAHERLILGVDSETGFIVCASFFSDDWFILFPRSFEEENFWGKYPEIEELFLEYKRLDEQK